MKAFILAAILFAGAVTMVSAHHNPGGILPAVPNTPAIQQMFASGRLTHCLNSATANYPGFRGQLIQVLDAYKERYTLDYRLLGGTVESASAAQSAGCDVWHEGRSDNFCSGCAADVTYGNYPATIRYKLSLGYVYWLSTSGHELGHVLGEHEGYDDVNFVSHINTYGRWAPPWNAPTVMDFGTQTVNPPAGYWAPTEADYRVATTWLYPKALPVVSSNPAYEPNVYWCGADKAVTRVALIYWTPNTGNYWSGATFVNNPDRNGCQGAYIVNPPPPQDRWCGVKAENAISWRFGLTEVWTPC